MRAVTYKGLGTKGRLGNQLFAIAGTIGMARSLDFRPVVDPSWPYAPFFSLPEDWYCRTPADHVSEYVAGNYWRRTYLQDPDLWSHCEDEIRAAFAPSPRAVAVLDALPQPGPTDVAVHVRRTDYAKFPDHLPMLPARYYHAASLKLELAAGDRLKHDVYGDDYEWARSQLPDRWTWVTHDADGPEPCDWLDMHLMARYRNLIVANSSYSWWAAWLASPDAIVVCPSVWFGPAIPVASPALPDWIEVAA